MNIDPYRFEVIEVRERARVRVRLRGELDLATAGAVADRLHQLRDGADTVVLDLEELSFMDAAGLRVVLAAAEDSRRDGWAFTVTRGSAPVQRLFELLDVSQYVTFEDGTS